MLPWRLLERSVVALHKPWDAHMSSILAEEQCIWGETVVLIQEGDGTSYFLCLFDNGSVLFLSWDLVLLGPVKLWKS